jgi:uncharacterized repeat protein (TIGR01451 family)
MEWSHIDINSGDTINFNPGVNLVFLISFRNVGTAAATNIVTSHSLSACSASFTDESFCNQASSPVDLEPGSPCGVNTLCTPLMSASSEANSGDCCTLVYTVDWQGASHPITFQCTICIQ